MARSRRNKGKGPLSNSRYSWGSGEFYHNPATTQVQMVENIYIRRFAEMSVNSYKWLNLPDEIDERYLELNVFRRGLAVFFHDDELGKYMCLPGSGHGFLDWQDNPVRFNVVGNQLYNKTLDADDVVPIWANRTRVPNYDILLWYARRLAEVETTVDINVKSARLTRILAASENMRLSVTNMLRQIDQGNPTVFVEPDMTESDVLSVLDMGANPEHIISVQMVKNRIMNDAMTFLGINTSNTDKRERMNSDEVNADEEQVRLNRNIGINARQEAADKINKKWGLNISVDWDDAIFRDSGVENGEDEGNGRVYDDASGDSGE